MRAAREREQVRSDSGGGQGKGQAEAKATARGEAGPGWCPEGRRWGGLSAEEAEGGPGGEGQSRRGGAGRGRGLWAGPGEGRGGGPGSPNSPAAASGPCSWGRCGSCSSSPPRGTLPRGQGQVSPQQGGRRRADPRETGGWPTTAGGEVTLQRDSGGRCAPGGQESPLGGGQSSAQGPPGHRGVGAEEGCGWRLAHRRGA